MMDYPNRTHCICEGDGTTLHLYSLLTRYLEQNLPAGGPTAPRRSVTTSRSTRRTVLMRFTDAVLGRRVVFGLFLAACLLRGAAAIHPRRLRRLRPDRRHPDARRGQAAHRDLPPEGRRGPLPFLFVRTPYGVERLARTRSPPATRTLADDGYIFVFQDIRGRYKSEGTFVMKRPPRRRRADPRRSTRGTDALDTIDWLVKNVPDNNGRVGHAGHLVRRLAAVMALLEPHPALKAASPQASPADMFLGDDFHHNGAFRLSYGFEYAALMETSKVNSRFDFDRHDTFEWYLELGPLVERQRRYLKGKNSPPGTTSSSTPTTTSSGSGRRCARIWAGPRSRR